MFRFFIMVLTCANMVFMCKWVCIDKNNNIKKYYFNQSAVKLEIPKHAISIPEVQNHRKRVPIPGGLFLFIGIYLERTNFLTYLRHSDSTEIIFNIDIAQLFQFCFIFCN